MRRETMMDDELLARFEAATLPKEEFHHREHVRVAFSCLTRSEDFGEGAVRFPRALRRFAATNGVPQLVHETLTWAYLALIFLLPRQRQEP